MEADTNTIISKLYARLDTHMKEVVRGASTAFALKVLAAGLAFGLNVVLGRTLGASGAGLYFLAFGATAIAAEIGRLGLAGTLVRYVARFASSEQWGSVRGVYDKAMGVALVASLLSATALYLLAPILASKVFSEPALTPHLQLMALAVLPLALFRLYANALQGLKRVRDSLLVQSVLPPLLTLPLVAWLGPAHGVSGAVVSYTFAAWIVLVIGLWQWRRLTPHLKAAHGVFGTRDLFASCVPLFWGSVLQMIMNWGPTLLLGVWADSAQVGVFALGSRIAGLTSFVLVAVNSIVAPKFAALYAERNTVALSSTARNSAKLMTLVAGPLLLVFLVFPESIMSVFGKEFVNGATMLTILALGQFVNVVTGSVRSLLIMSGNERLFRNNQIACVLLLLALSLALIPVYGGIGAAVAAATTLSVQNISAALLVRWKLGISTLPGGWI